MANLEIHRSSCAEQTRSYMCDVWGGYTDHTADSITPL